MARFDKSLVIEKRGLLLCEGEDEVNFFNAWFVELGMSHVQVIAYNGKSKLAVALSDLPKVSGFSQVRQIAITRDADEDAKAARMSLENAVAGSPVSGMQPKLFVLPDDEHQGALETLWLNSLSEQPYAPCIASFFECISAKGWKESATWARKDKAHAQLWIATKDVPNERFGIAAWHGRRDIDKEWMRECWVDFDHAAFAKLKAFLLGAFP